MEKQEAVGRFFCQLGEDDWLNQLIKVDTVAGEVYLRRVDFAGGPALVEVILKLCFVPRSRDVDEGVRQGLGLRIQKAVSHVSLIDEAVRRIIAEKLRVEQVRSGDSIPAVGAVGPVDSDFIPEAVAAAFGNVHACRV